MQIAKLAMTQDFNSIEANFIAIMPYNILPK